MVETYLLCHGGPAIMTPQFAMRSDELVRLPDAGGLNDQSAWLMDAFMIVGAALRKLREGAS